MVYVPKLDQATCLNVRYYSDDENSYYALPTEIVYANFENVDNNEPLLLESDGRFICLLRTIRLTHRCLGRLYTDK